MTNNDTLEKNPATPELIKDLTPELVKGEILLALTAAEQSIQLLHTAKSKLVFNEDNLVEIKKYLDDCKKSADTVEAEREKKKKPFWDNGKAVDAGAKLLSTEIEDLRKEVYGKYAPLCALAEKKKADALAEEQREKAIQEQMATFKTTHAVKIADAKTYKELVEIERLINLETANRSKYGKHTDAFKIECKEITDLVRQKKEAARELERLGNEGLKAAENGSDEKVLEIMDKKEDLQAKLAEIGVSVVEKAVNQSTKPTGYSTQIFTSVPKGGRKLWKYEVVDIRAAEKAGLTLTVINEAKVKEILAKKRDDEMEVTENGIKYFIDKRY